MDSNWSRILFACSPHLFFFRLPSAAFTTCRPNSLLLPLLELLLSRLFPRHKLFSSPLWGSISWFLFFSWFSIPFLSFLSFLHGNGLRFFLITATARRDYVSFCLGMSLVQKMKECQLKVRWEMSTRKSASKNDPCAALHLLPSFLPEPTALTLLSSVKVSVDHVLLSSLLPRWAEGNPLKNDDGIWTFFSFLDYLNNWYKPPRSDGEHYKKWEEGKKERERKFGRKTRKSGGYSTERREESKTL